MACACIIFGPGPTIFTRWFSVSLLRAVHLYLSLFHFYIPVSVSLSKKGTWKFQLLLPGPDSFRPQTSRSNFVSITCASKDGWGEILM